MSYGEMTFGYDDEVIAETIKTYDAHYMMTMFCEEFAEVIQAISKFVRMTDDDARIESIDRCLEHINEEVADVIICIAEMERYGVVDCKDVQRWIEAKQNRQKNRNAEKREKDGEKDLSV